MSLYRLQKWDRGGPTADVIGRAEVSIFFEVVPERWNAGQTGAWLIVSSITTLIHERTTLVLLKDIRVVSPVH